MNTDQLLEALKELPLINRWVIFPNVKEYYEVEKEQMEAILSLLSQQAVVDSDEDILKYTFDKQKEGFDDIHRAITKTFKADE